MSISLEEQLEQFAKTDKWRKLIQNAKKAGAISDRKRSATSREIGIDDVKMLSNIMRDILSAINTRFPHVSDDIFSVYDMGYRGDQGGRSEYRIYFHGLAKPSIYPEGYPDGLENILALFSHGSEPSKKAVWDRAGLEWNFGKRGRGIRKQHREWRKGRHIFIRDGWYKKPDPFLINAIDALSLKYPDAKITLNRKYYPNS